MGPQFGKTTYISNVKRDKKSGAQVTTNKTSDLVQKLFPWGWLGRTMPPTQIFFKLSELSQTSRARNLIFGLQVNIDKANSRRYHITR